MRVLVRRARTADRRAAGAARSRFRRSSVARAGYREGREKLGYISAPALSTDDFRAAVEQDLLESLSAAAALILIDWHLRSSITNLFGQMLPEAAVELKVSAGGWEA